MSNRPSFFWLPSLVNLADFKYCTAVCIHSTPRNFQLYLREFHTKSCPSQGSSLDKHHCCSHVCTVYTKDRPIYGCLKQNSEQNHAFILFQLATFSIIMMKKKIYLGKKIIIPSSLQVLENWPMLDTVLPSTAFVSSKPTRPK